MADQAFSSCLHNFGYRREDFLCSRFAPWTQPTQQDRSVLDSTLPVYPTCQFGLLARPAWFCYRPTTIDSGTDRRKTDQLKSPHERVLLLGTVLVPSITTARLDPSVPQTQKDSHEKRDAHQRLTT